MTTWNESSAPTWQPAAAADQLGWCDESTGEVLVSTKPTTVDVTFLNQEERAKALAWVRAGLLTPTEAGLVGVGGIASLTLIDGGEGFTAAPIVTVVGVGTLAVVVAVLSGGIGKVISVAINVAGAGTGYNIGDELVINDTGVDAVVKVTAIGASGEITAVVLLYAGKNYTADSLAVAGVPIYENVVGTGALFDLTIGYPIGGFSITTAGTEYIPHDTTVTIAGGTTAAAKVNILDIGSGDFATMEALAISRM